MNIPLIIYWCWTHHSPSRGIHEACNLWVPHQDDEPRCEITPAVVTQVAHP